MIGTFELLGMLSLIRNSIKDRKTLKIDSRWNYMMYGSVTMLVSWLGVKSSWLIYSIILNTIMAYAFKKVGIGNGDTQAFIWINMSLLAYSPIKLWLFYVLFTICYATLVIIARRNKNENNKFAGYPIILSSYAVVTLLL